MLIWRICTGVCGGANDFILSQIFGDINIYKTGRLLPSPVQTSPPHLLFSLASSSEYCLNSSYIFLLKLSLRKKDQNLNRVFISWDWPMPNRFLSETHGFSHQGAQNQLYVFHNKLHCVQIQLFVAQSEIKNHQIILPLPSVIMRCCEWTVLSAHRWGTVGGTCGIPAE